MEGSRGLENVEKELKPIRYQSEIYSKVTSVINRVNVASLWDAHEHQKRGKAVGIDGVDKDNGRWVFPHTKTSWFNTSWRMY